MGDFSEKQKAFINNLFQQLNTTINETASQLRNELVKQIEPLKSEICAIKSNFEEKISIIEAENKELRDKIVSLERKQRKNNLIIFGIDNADSDVAEKVIALFNDHLEINIVRTDIKEAYRLENRNNSGKSPVLVSFSTYEKKLEVLKNSSKLKGESIYISSDQCWEDRELMKQLLQYRKKFRDRGETAYIRDRKLIVSNKPFTIEQLENRYIEQHKKIEERELLDSQIIELSNEDAILTQGKHQDREGNKQRLIIREISTSSTNEGQITTRSHLKK